MGVIRKTLAVSTLGVIRPNSKKQRSAKKQLKATKAQTAAIIAAGEQTAAMTAAAALANRP